MAIKVALRKKSISKGRLSLYLDFYPPIPHPETGKLTRREFLGLYIDARPKNPIAKQNNSNTIQLADQIRLKRENYLNKPEIYSEYEKEQLRIKEQGERSFLAYFEKLADKREDANRNNWLAALKYLKEFSGGEIKFSDLNESYLNDFKEFLSSAKSHRSDKTSISTNTAVSYFNKVKASLKQAYKEDLLPKDLNSKISTIKQAETRREFLTLEELNRLVETPCKDETLKKAAFFSTLTGLRFSDIQKLTWKEVEFIEGQGYFLNFRQKKTRDIEKLPIADQAVELLGEPAEEEDRVFQSLQYSAYKNRFLAEWIEKAGITKKITFHCFRHTYATLQLFNGTDIFTVSKMLGHKNLKTTQVYAKIVDETKRQATNRIKLNF